MMKKFYFVLIMAIMSAASVFGQSKQLYNFEQVLDALKLGINVNVVIHYSDCRMEVEGEIYEESIDAIGGMKIDANEYFAPMSINNEKAYIVTSKNTLIENPLGDGFVYNYVKLKVDEDDRVIISAKYLQAKNYEVIMDEKFYGEINNGENGACVYFYIND